ncbi:uncharacterized protein LOC110034975, partial [Phalaenopsis equestris]|uniref:uncharacterized protein LOC110034975 n=1 Tax=Phalaenopsis equestris TaxID=78828 RepID=UPI0009E4AC1C
IYANAPISSFPPSLILVSFYVFEEALQDQRVALAAALDSTVGESSPSAGNLPNGKAEDIYEPVPLGINIQTIDGASGSGENNSCTQLDFHVHTVETVKNMEELQFIPSFANASPLHKNQEDDNEEKCLSALRNSSDEDFSVSLHLGDREPRRPRSDPTSAMDSASCGYAAVCGHQH